MLIGALSLVTLVTACGGGGGGGGTSGSTSGGSTPAIQQTAEGLWNGTASPGGAVKMLVRANGAFYQFYGTAAPVGQLFGTLSVSANNSLSFDTSSGRVELYEPGWTVVASSVITNSTLNFSLSGGGRSRVVNQTFDSTYNSPFTKADLVGNYSGVTVGQNSTFSIDSNGNISGTAPRRITTGGCSFSGTITPDQSKRFAFVVISGCDDSVDGIGVALLVGSGTGQQIYIGTQSGYGYTLYGVKQ
jgi:hypothetical protein